MSQMDSRYFEYPPGSGEHRAAYAEAFAAAHGAGFPAEGDADLSYGIDNACELAALRCDGEPPDWAMSPLPEDQHADLAAPESPDDRAEVPW